jgi:succinyl-CoA synthetase alpha subunit
MSILVDHDTRLLVQGIDTQQGALYVDRILSCGTPVVAGASFGQGGTWVSGIPVFDTVQEAVHATDANTSLVCTPAEGAAEAILESADAGLALAVCVSAGVPIRDMVTVEAHLASHVTCLLGPGCVGVFSPGKCMAGIIPPYVVQPGAVGVVSRSGSLAYEVAWLLTQAGFGQSTILSIGTDTIVGTGFVDILAMFEDDPLTQQVVLIGEVGGREEEAAARFVADRMTKPLVAYVAGQTSPPGRQMGHAGAVIEAFADTAQYKIEALAKSGARVARSPGEIPGLLERREH